MISNAHHTTGGEDTRPRERVPAHELKGSVFSFLNATVGQAGGGRAAARAKRPSPAAKVSEEPQAKKKPSLNVQLVQKAQEVRGLS